MGTAEFELYKRAFNNLLGQFDLIIKMLQIINTSNKIILHKYGWNWLALNNAVAAANSIGVGNKSCEGTRTDQCDVLLPSTPFT